MTILHFVEWASTWSGPRYARSARKNCCEFYDHDGNRTNIRCIEDTGDFLRDPNRF